MSITVFIIYLTYFIGVLLFIELIKHAFMTDEEAEEITFLGAFVTLLLSFFSWLACIIAVLVLFGDKVIYRKNRSKL